MLTQFNKQQKAIADEFGVIGVNEMRDDLTGASEEFVRLGLEGSEALKTVKQLSSNFGIALSETTLISDSVGEIAVALGTGVESSTTLFGMLDSMAGLSTIQSEELLKQVYAFSAMNDVVPSDVLQEVANSTEYFAKYAKDGGDNVFRAAVQAKKLGINLSTVEKISDGLLDFQSSLNKEIEASVLLGRDVNLQQARELAVLGKQEELQKEILRVVGSQAEFNEMLPYERQALADALNMEVNELSKIVNKEKEQVTLAGELSKMSTKGLVSDETITNTAMLLNNLKALGMQIAEDFAPALESILSPFASLIGWLSESNLLFPIMTAFMVGSITKSILLTNAMFAQAAAAKTLAAANLVEAGSEVATGAAKQASWFSWMGPAGWIMAAAGAAGLIAYLATFKGGLQTGTELGGIKGDTVQALHKGETVLNTKDTEMLATSLNAVRSGTGGGNTTVNMDTSKMEKQNMETNRLLSQYIKRFDSAFGFGGTAISGIGSKVGSQVEKFA